MYQEKNEAIAPKRNNSLKIFPYAIQGVSEYLLENGARETLSQDTIMSFLVLHELEIINAVSPVF